MRDEGVEETRIQELLFEPAEKTQPNAWIFGGSLVFVAFTLGVGVSGMSYAEEIVLLGSLAIVLFLMHRLLRELDLGIRKALVGTALIGVERDAVEFDANRVHVALSGPLKMGRPSLRFIRKRAKSTCSLLSLDSTIRDDLPMHQLSKSRVRRFASRAREVDRF